MCIPRDLGANRARTPTRYVLVLVQNKRQKSTEGLAEGYYEGPSRQITDSDTSKYYSTSYLGDVPPSPRHRSDAFITGSDILDASTHAHGFVEPEVEDSECVVIHHEST